MRSWLEEVARMKYQSLGMQQCRLCDKTFSLTVAEVKAAERLREDGVLGPQDYACVWCSIEELDKLIKREAV
ncbi:MAG TPA: hypothetical protein VNO17_09515 [Actinomycetota bacterium]|nr:hypothetical protein [Actinomycetota bacterium]